MLSREKIKICELEFSQIMKYHYYFVNCLWTLHLLWMILTSVILFKNSYFQMDKKLKDET